MDGGNSFISNLGRSYSEKNKKSAGFIVLKRKEVYLMLTVDYILGLVDGEGSFNVLVNEDKKRKRGLN